MTTQLAEKSIANKRTADQALAARSRKLRRFINFYPPYLGAAVRVTHITEDFRRVEVEMPLRFYNRNYVGTHFGGSLYAMCDPFYMLMLMNILGPGYIVWDKAATIRFKRPGSGLVKATFTIPEEKIAENSRRCRFATQSGAGVSRDRHRCRRQRSGRHRQA